MWFWVAEASHGEANCLTGLLVHMEIAQVAPFARQIGQLVEMGLVRVAQAIAEGKVKVTVADLDRLIRLEEFLREEDQKDGGIKVILDWRDGGSKGEEEHEDEDGDQDQ